MLSLQGCGFLNLWRKPAEPITTVKQAEERVPLNLPAPTPLKMSPPKWIVVTPNNASKVWKDLQDKKVDLVLFALTDDGYESLAMDMLSLRNFIEQQRQVLQEYKKYYEPPKKDNQPKTEATK